MTAEHPPRVVFDCVIYLQASLSESGPAAAALALAEVGRCQLFVSDEILEEVRDVLSRPRLAGRTDALTLPRIATFLDRLQVYATLVADVPALFNSARDPKDDCYVNLALACDARYLVTQDNDLLDLMDAATVDGQAFRLAYPGLTILRPGHFAAEPVRVGRSSVSCS